jgi:tRNA pseudouridine32 synthase/23S rRNA pseudouridine746 synthase
VQEWSYEPPTGPVEIVHHDRDLVAINKPSGLLSVPGRGAALADCASVRVAEQLGQRVFPVHRLDMDTSGLMVLATRRKAERALKQQFQERRPVKCYRARVWGQLKPDEGTVRLALRREEGRPRSVVDPEGRPAHTDWRVVHRAAGSTLVELRPRTGRSHQLRVHLMALGHAILGDRFYAEGPALAAASRLLLHAWRLTVAHPYSGAPLELVAPLPVALSDPSAPTVPDALR